MVDWNATAGLGSPTVGSTLSAAAEAQTGAAAAIQGEFLSAYQQLTDAWLTRVDAEAAFWSELHASLSQTRSLREALRTYQEFVARRMQISAKDGRGAIADSQRILSAPSRSLTGKSLSGEIS
jgi:hypothetical protein